MRNAAVIQSKNRDSAVNIANRVNSYEQLTAEFIAAKDVKESSRALYSRTLRLYFTWIAEQGYELSQLSRADIIAYKQMLLNSGRSALTVGSYINSVRLFYEWAEANKLYPNIAKGVKAPKRKQQFKKQPLMPEQATALLEQARGRGLRDYAIINLLLRTGLRTIELIQANVEDVTFKGRQRVLLVQGKGHYDKDNFVVLTPKAYEPIAEYLSSRGAVKASEPLFTSESNNSKGGRLTTRTISQIAKQALQATGLDERCFTAHSLRHTAAVNILRAGGSLETAQFTLRHANIATTQIYTATLREEQRLASSGEAMLDSIY